MASTDMIVLLFAILLIVGVLTTKFSNRLGLPSLVLFIAVGMLLNRFIYFDNAEITQLFGILALIVILFEGGFQTKWREVKPVVYSALSLATLGVVFTTAVIGFFAWLILDVDWEIGLLFGAIVGSTDAAAVFAVLGGKNIKQKLKSTLEAESGSNDPMAVFLTVSLIALIQMPDQNGWLLLVHLVWQMGFGLAMGLILGKLALWAINKINLESSGLYPVFALAFAIFTYGTTSMLKGSGLLAVYIMGLIIGNSNVVYRHSIFRFNEGFAWMMHILMFILLGLLSFPRELLNIIWQGLALSFILMFVARPIGVFISTLFSKYSLKDKLFISWAGLRGAVPVVLATYPLVAGLPDGKLLFDVVFFVVLTSALLQGATLSKLASVLGLTQKKKPASSFSLELIAMGKTNSDMVEIEVEERSGAVSKEIRQLHLPDNVLISAVVRGDKLITPRGSTVLQAHDIVYLLTPRTLHEQINRLFQNEEEAAQEIDEEISGSIAEETEIR